MTLSANGAPKLTPVAGRDEDDAAGTGVAAALALCEAGDWEGIRRLRAWNGGRLRITLERMLRDQELAAQALEAALDDIWRHAGVHRAAQIDPEDWLFGRLRKVAQSYQSSARGAPRLRPVPEAAIPTAAPAAHAATPLAPTQPVAEQPDDLPATVNTRIRRPSAPVQSRAASTSVAQEEPRAKTRVSWPRLLLLWLLAGTLGFALALGALYWLTGATIAPPPLPAPAVDLVPPPADTALPAPSPSPPSARELLGPPLVAREPSTTAVRDMPPLTAAPPAAQAPLVELQPAAEATPSRVVIHHGLDPDSREVAQRMADQLRRAGYGTVAIRSVTFEIGAASVRFFHADDRLAAQRLVSALEPFLAWQGRAAPAAPSDFTDFRPLPRLGALEIWLPPR